VRQALLRDRAALVTGASSGIGRAIAVGLGAEGTALCLAGRDLGRLAEVEEAARQAGASRAVAVSLDATRDEDLRQLAARALAEFDMLDILVHSAGAYERGTSADAPVDAFDRQYRANLHAPYLLTQLLLPRLRAEGGDVVFINSAQGLAVSPSSAQFAATQHGLRAFADALRQEVNADGVRVMSIHLGRTATPRQERIFDEEGRPYAPELLLQPEDVAAMVLAALRLPHRAELTTFTMRPTVKSY
jgi:NADP-dependent 3-hydroxy acid dehydrogenase YdfG